MLKIIFIILTSLLFSNFEKEIQTQFILAEAGDTISIPEGTYPIRGSLSIEGKENVVVMGHGMNKSVLSFKNQTDGAEGLKITNCKNISLVDFAVEDSKGDAIKTQDVNGITFTRVRAEWTNGPDEKNGAYGLYPVLCENVIIEESKAVGASDAGIYVGQSKNIIVRNSEAYHNVAGIEIENSIQADVYNNHAHHNTGGILVFDLPDLVQKEGENIRVFNNISEYNNLDNFAPEGNIVGKVPSGTGIMILATNNVEIFDNQIIENKTVGTAIVSYFITEEPISDSLYNPYTSSIYIHDNVYKRSKQIPDLDHEIGQLLFLKFWRDIPNIVYDGMPDPQYLDKDGKVLSGHQLCVNNNVNGTFLNLDIGNNFEKWYTPFLTRFSTDDTEFNCSLKPIKITTIP